MAMSILQEIENQVAALTPAENAELLHSVARDLGGFPGIESIPGVCGGDACIMPTRIQLTEAGAIEGQLIRINRPRA